MRFGVVTGNFGSFGADPGVDGCRAVAEAAEALGHDSVWVHDHVVMPSGIRSRYRYHDTGVPPFRVEQHGLVGPAPDAVRQDGEVPRASSGIDPTCSQCRSPTAQPLRPGR